MTHLFIDSDNLRTICEHVRGIDGKKGNLNSFQPKQILKMILGTIGKDLGDEIDTDKLQLIESCFG